MLMNLLFLQIINKFLLWGDSVPAQGLPVGRQVQSSRFKVIRFTNFEP
jgi:hypothetical protein